MCVRSMRECSVGGCGSERCGVEWLVIGRKIWCGVKWFLDEGGRRGFSVDVDEVCK